MKSIFGLKNLLVWSSFCYETPFCVLCLHSSEEWNKLEAEARKKLGIDFEDDGEFWSV